MASEILLKLKQKVIFVFLLSLILGITFVSPQAQVKELTPYDYEETLIYGQTSFGRAVAASFTESDRFRPIYYLKDNLMYSFYGLNSRLYYFTNGVILGLTIFFAWLVVGTFSLLDFSFISLAVFLLPPTVENYFRLGTAEPLFTLFLVGSIYFLLSKKYYFFILSTILLLLSKESAVFFVFVYIFFAYWIWGKKQLWPLLLIYSTYVVILLKRYSYAVGERYLSQFTFDAFKIVGNIFKYLINDWAVFILLFWSFILFFRGLRKRKYFKNQKGLLLITLSIVSLVPLIFRFSHYYLFPTLVLTIITFTMTLKNNVLRNGIIASRLFWLVLVLLQIGTTVKVAISWHRMQIGNAALTRYLYLQKYRFPNRSYYFANPGLIHDLTGTWMLLSDFGRSKVNFSPDANYAWQIYEKEGEASVNSLNHEVRTLYSYSKNRGDTVLIDNPCIENNMPGYEPLPLCGTSIFLKDPVCGWCVVK